MNLTTTSVPQARNHPITFTYHAVMDNDANDYSRLAAELAGATGHQHEQHQLQQSPQDNDGTNGKRKAEDGQGAGQRAKRNRYISIACNECKRYNKLVTLCVDVLR